MPVMESAEVMHSVSKLTAHRNLKTAHWMTFRLCAEGKDAA